MDKNKKNAGRTANDANNGGSKRGALGVARRSIWYVLRLMVILTLVLIGCYLALVEGMYVSNIYIIVTEGMERRADCILGANDTGLLDLREHFYEGWLYQDADLETNKYDAFRVESYDYRLGIEKLAVYPWSDKATLRVVERVVNIQASAYNDANTDPLPQWENSRMEIELEKIDGRWYITKLTKLEIDPEIEPQATPDYSQLETDIPHY